jgi:hypothetical protein
MSNMKALASCNHKSLIQLMFLCSSNSKVKGQKVKVMVSNEKSHQKKYTCEI